MSPQFMAGVGTAMKDLLLAHVASALAGVDINVFGVDVHPFAFLQQWSDDLRTQANAAINQAAAAQSGVKTVAQGVTGPITGTASSDPNAVHAAVSQLQGQVNSKPNYSDIPTNIPLWVNVNPGDDPTFPITQLVEWTDVSGGTNGNPATGSETDDPSYAPATDVLELGFIRATRNRHYTTIGMVTGNAAWGLAPLLFYVYLYKMDPTTGDLTQLWNSGDVTSQISTAGTQLRLTMPTVTAAQGDIFAVGVQQHAPTIGTAVRPLACVRQSQPAQPAGVYPRNIYAYYNATSSYPAPTTIPASQLKVGTWIPWFVLGQ
ncbi:hypothetical protein [Nocardia terpenica]|nr:hypothetical protein [Nocardia terpenica]NQE89984.1 hypothetical protein [Nocardia terpenica]